MNPLVKEFLESILTKVLTAGAAYLVTTGWITEEQSGRFVLGLVAFAVSIAWSLWQRYVKQTTLVSALALPPGSTIAQAKAVAKSDEAPPASLPADQPVRPISSHRIPVILIALMIGSGGLVACAKADPNMSPERKVALYGIQVAKSVKAAQDAAHTLYQGGAIHKEQYSRVLDGFIKVNAAGEKLGEALAAYDAATSPVERDRLVGLIDGALVTIGTLLPETFAPVTTPEARQKIGAIIGEVQKLLITIARFTAPKTAHDLRRIPSEHSWQLTTLSRSELRA